MNNKESATLATCAGKAESGPVQERWKQCPGHSQSQDSGTTEGRAQFGSFQAVLEPVLH